MAVPDPGEVTNLLGQLHRGNRDVEAKLIRLVYDELRRLAARYMRGERVDHTLQPTAVVNEAVMKLSARTTLDFQSRSHFIGSACNAMVQVLIDHARKRKRIKREAGHQRVPLDGLYLFPERRSEELLQMEPALERLEMEHPRQAQMVKMRFFFDLSVEEIAGELKVSSKTVKRDWVLARAWLKREINDGAAS